MSTLRPRTLMSIATSQERTQHKWQNLQHWALGCPAFVNLLYILAFGLDPSQAGLLDKGLDLPRACLSQTGPYPMWKDIKTIGLFSRNIRRVSISDVAL